MSVPVLRRETSSGDTVTKLRDRDTTMHVANTARLFWPCNANRDEHTGQNAKVCKSQYSRLWFATKKRKEQEKKKQIRGKKNVWKVEAGDGAF